MAGSHMRLIHVAARAVNELAGADKNPGASADISLCQELAKEWPQ
jgi:hypothetical protein